MEQHAAISMINASVCPLVQIQQASLHVAPACEWYVANYLIIFVSLNVDSTHLEKMDLLMSVFV